MASIGGEWPWICALKSLQGASLGKGDMEDKLLPMQQVPPLHVADVIQEKGKSPYSLVRRSCQNDVEVNDKLP